MKLRDTAKVASHNTGKILIRSLWALKVAGLVEPKPLVKFGWNDQANLALLFATVLLLLGAWELLLFWHSYGQSGEASLGSWLYLFNCFEILDG